MTDWITRADKAANFMVDTDLDIAELKVKHERDKRKAKRIYSATFLRIGGWAIDDDGKARRLTVAEREAETITHHDYQTAEAAEMTSLLEFEKLRNQRDSAQLIIDFWRSYQKAVREGEI